MSKAIELSADSQCILCDLRLAQNRESYVLYQCFCCRNITPYCFPCKLKMQRLFGNGNFFKCIYCNKLTTAIDILEVKSQNICNQLNLIPSSKSISNNNISFLKTPNKAFKDNNNSLISSIKINNGINEEERKDNGSSSNFSEEKVISDFIKEFNMVNLALKSDENDIPNISQTQNDNLSTINDIYKNTISINRGNKINNNNRNKKDISNISNNKRTLVNSNSTNNMRENNDYSLLKSKSRINKRFCLNDSFLGKKREDSETAGELRGFNKSREKVPLNNMNFSIRPKGLISRKMSKAAKVNNLSLSTANIDLNSAICNFRSINPNLNNIFGNNYQNSGFPIFNDNNMNTNLFVNRSGIFPKGFNNIDGSITPHRIYDNTKKEFF